MSPTQQKYHFRKILFTLFVCGGMFVHALRAEVFVDDSPLETNRPAAIASDYKTASEFLPAEEVAREVLRLQQQMGGSVVTDRPNLQGWNSPPSPVTPKTVPINKIDELREAAWQLDTTAHRLENLDLYDQADALRDLANRLRRDAREMKQAAETTAVRQSCQ